MSSGILHLFQPGRRIYLPGASGESLALTRALAAEPERLRGVEVVSCLIPGANGFDYAALHETARLTVFMLPGALRSSFEAGRVRLVPLSYSGIASYLDRLPLDVAVAHVAPPNGETASLGVAADFTLTAWRRARTRLALINPAVPDIPGAPRLDLSEADQVATLEGPLVEMQTATPSDEAIAIARSAAALVPDGAAIQVGVGGAPGAIWDELAGHRDLQLASGLVAEGYLRLADAGALRPDAPHRTGIALGSAEFYRRLAERGGLRFAPATETHDVASLARLERFTAINAALQVDLFGQVNLEWQGRRVVSGVGGAPEFMRAAALAPRGRALTLMPSTAKGGAISRIVARLDSPTASIPRNDVDVVVTEHGVAKLRGLSLDERANALIAIADPLWRNTLSVEWDELRRKL